MEETVVKPLITTLEGLNDLLTAEHDGEQSNIDGSAHLLAALIDLDQDQELFETGSVTFCWGERKFEIVLTVKEVK